MNAPTLDDIASVFDDVVLMNLGDNLRVYHNAQNEPFAVEIGKSVRATLHPAITRFIRESASKNDTVVLMDATTAVPDQLMQAMQLLAIVDSEPYDDLLSRTIELVGPYEGVMRPTRNQIRDKLRLSALDLARSADLVAGALTHKAPEELDYDDIKPVHAGRVTINEEGDPVELERERERSEPQHDERKVEEPKDDDDTRVRHSRPKAKAKSKPAKTAKPRARVRL